MALGSYNDFIKSMLSLREQRLQEERYKQLERMENQERMSKMMAGMGEQAGQMFQTMGQNQMANRMMSEYGMGGGTAPPRAGTVNTPWSNQVAAGRPDFYPAGRGTGGMPELKMRMEMQQQNSLDQWRAAQLGQKQEDLNFKKSSWLVGQATAANKLDAANVAAKNKGLDSDYSANLKYITNRKVAMDAIKNAASPEEHEIAVTSLTALDAAAQQRGLKVEVIDQSKIPPFMSEDDRTALETQQTAVSEARTALEEVQKAEPSLGEKAIGWTGLGAILGEGVNIPGVGKIPGLGYKIPSEKEADIATAQQRYKQEQQKLRETPGASFYGEKPVTPKTTTTAPKKTGALTEAIPVGTTKPFRNKATGEPEMFKWDGTQWVPQ